MEQDELRTLVIELLALVNKREPDEESIEEVDDILENNYLNDDENVPSWLTDMFRALIEERAVQPSPLTTAVGDDGSPTNFLVELQDLLDMEWVEYGEYFLMQFPSIGFEAKVSAEENTYAVRKLGTRQSSANSVTA